LGFLKKQVFLNPGVNFCDLLESDIFRLDAIQPAASEDFNKKLTYEVEILSLFRISNIKL